MHDPVMHNLINRIGLHVHETVKHHTKKHFDAFKSVVIAHLTATGILIVLITWDIVLRMRHP
jgi:hypothetical protein